MIDNVVRPLIVKEKVKMPLILVFFSILGGISLFGLIGIIMGPLIVALFVSVVEIFRFTEEK
jgi:predicted PurR-regulated permease PerM